MTSSGSKPADSMLASLALVGNRPDFETAGGSDNPEWEHVVMRRGGRCSIVAIDELASRSTNRLIRNRYVDIGMVMRLGARLASESFVLAQSEQSGYQAALALALRPSAPPLSIIFHGHRWWTRRNRALAAVARRMRRTKLLCLSSSLRDLVLREYGFPEDRVITTGFGIDANFFKPVRNDDARIIVSAGTASRDYRLLVEACRDLDGDVRIAADSNWYREGLNLQGVSIPANVSIFSAGSNVALRALYARAAFVVVPLVDTPHACGYAVIAEAMAMGKAVIATRNATPSDLITEGVTGFYVPPGDVDALRAAIDRLWSDQALAQRMGEAARVAVERSFNLDAYVGRLQAAMGRV